MKDDKPSIDTYKILFDTTPDGVLIADIKTKKFKLANPAICEMLGYREEELMNMSVGDIHPKDQLKYVISEFEAQARGEKTLSVNLPCLRKDGTVFYADVNTKIGEIEGRACNLGFFRDVTERKKIEDELKKSEARYKVLFEGSPDGIIVADVNTGAYSYVNPAICNALGYSEEEIKKVSQFRGIHPKEETERIKGLFYRQARGEIDLAEDIPFVKKDGTLRYFDVKSVHMEIDGVQRVLGLTRDITERRRAELHLGESEEKFKTLSEDIPNMVFINQKGKIKFANKACERIMGYKLNELCSEGFDFLTLIAPENKESVQSLFEKHMSGREMAPYEAVLLTKDHKTINVIISTKLINFHGDKAILGVVTDIAERKKIEEVLKQKTHELGERVKELNCIFGLSKILSQSDISLDELFQQTVQLIPPAWQYPEITCGRIIFKEKEYKTGHFKQSAWRLAVDIMIRDEKKGEIEVYYTRERPERDEGPFLKEERNLIHILALRLGSFIEQREAEEKTRLSEERLRLIYELAPDAIYMNDMKGYFVDGNQASERMVGYSKEELVGKTFFETNLISKDQLAKAVKLLARLMMGKTTGPDEFVLKRRDGAKIIVEISCYPVTLEGKKLSLSIARDVTERRKAEEALKKSEEVYRILTESSPDSIKLFNRGGELQFINQAGLKEHKLKDLEEAMTYNFAASFIEKDREKVRHAFKEALEGKTSRLEAHHTKEGSDRECCAEMIMPIQDAKGKIVGVYWVSADISERAKSEETLQALARDLDQRAQELSRINAELEAFNRAAVGRETRMIELKREINKLNSELGQAPPYDLTFTEQ